MPTLEKYGGHGAAPVARIVADEAALYAATRNMHCDAKARHDLRLHAMLEQQLSEMAPRLAQLAECIGGSTVREGPLRQNAWRKRGAKSEGRKDDGGSIRALFARHRGLLILLRDATTVRAAHFEDEETAKLLADLIASHEEHAFKLRALLWEYGNGNSLLADDGVRAGATLMRR